MKAKTLIADVRTDALNLDTENNDPKMEWFGLCPIHGTSEDSFFAALCVPQELVEDLVIFDGDEDG